MNILSELDKKGVFTNIGDVDNFIGQVNRSKAEAHKRSTAVGIINGDISLDDLLITPEDLDGNEWIPKKCQIINTEGCIKGNAIDILAELGDSLGGSHWLCKLFWSCNDVSWHTAHEGYKIGTPARLPNTTDVPISTHILGLAVDVNYIQNGDYMEQNMIESIINIGQENGLCLPIKGENWQFEACP